MNSAFPYKETVRSPASAEGRIIRQNKSESTYAHVELAIAPVPKNAGVNFLDQATATGQIPEAFLPAIEDEVRSVLRQGALGFEVIGVSVSLTGGSYHEQDSTEAAFREAARTALRQALQKASPVLLEPVLLISITAPAEWIGSVIGELNSRGGRVNALEPLKEGAVTIKAEIAIGDLGDGFAGLSGMTRGTATCGAELAGYREVPDFKSPEEPPAFPYT